MVIERYNGSSCLIKELRELVNRKYSDLFVAVVAHGSVASDEVVIYSDFDGLVIVKDKWVGTKEFALFKKESMNRTSPTGKTAKISKDPCKHSLHVNS